MKKIIILIALAVVALLSAGCFQHNSTHSEEIPIGAIFNLTGSQKELDVPSAQGARAAVEQINRTGGLLGRKVTLVLEDGESMPGVVAKKTAKLFTDNPSMPAAIGLSDTDMVLAAAPVAAGHKRLFLTSGATSPLLPQQVPGYLFLTCFGDNVQAAAGAQWAYADLGARNVMILYDATSTYTQLLKKYFQSRFEELGGHIGKTTPYTPNDMSTLTIQSAPIDMVYLAATPDTVLPALAQLRRAGITAPVLGGDGLDIGEAWQKGREYTDIYFTTHAYLGRDAASPRIEAFRTSFARTYPQVEPDAFTALGFDSVQLLAEAIRKAGTIQPAAVRDTLADMQGFAGVTGEISYTSGSRIPLKSVSIIGVTRGRQRFVGEFLPAKIPEP